jgi:hypothetical protein
VNSILAVARLVLGEFREYRALDVSAMLLAVREEIPWGREDDSVNAVVPHVGNANGHQSTWEGDGTELLFHHGGFAPDCKYQIVGEDLERDLVTSPHDIAMRSTPRVKSQSEFIGPH